MKKFTCCGGELIHELDCKPTEKKRPKEQKKDENNQDWLLNTECDHCGRVYCDCEIKY